MTSLTDIVTNIHIQSDFCISHPHYRPFALPPDVVARFQQLPERLQHKYLNLMLRNFLHGIYFNGSLLSSLSLGSDTEDVTAYLALEPKTSAGIDLGFYGHLHASNSGTGYFDSGWQVVSEEPDGSLAVTKGGLTVHIDRFNNNTDTQPSMHLQTADRHARVGDFVAIKMPNHLLQNEFYLAISNAGSERQDYTDSHLSLVSIYFNFSPEGAVKVMHHLTWAFNTSQMPFTFKVLYNSSEYERYDSGILLFGRNYYPAVRQVLEVVCAEYQADFNHEIPLFTKFLASGLSLAEEPIQRQRPRESFGMNRCQIIASALLQAWLENKNSPAERMSLIIQHFSQLGLVLQMPYLNPNSEDLYSPLFI